MITKIPPEHSVLFKQRLKDASIKEAFCLLFWKQKRIDLLITSLKDGMQWKFAYLKAKTYETKHD